MSKTLKFRRQPIRKHFNVLTACLKVLLNWILFRLKMSTFSFNPTYVSVFSLWVNSLLFFIPSIKCHFDVIYISSEALRANTQRGRPDDMTDSGWVSNSMSSELDLTEFKTRLKTDKSCRHHWRGSVISLQLGSVSSVPSECCLNISC